MAFTASLTVRDTVAIITMEGDLDAATAPVFQERIAGAAQSEPTLLVLDMAGLRYLSSAGQRQLVVARQKMNDDVRLVLVGASPSVAETIRLVGFDQSVTFTDRLPV
jgi:anti-anti-sigma factor